MPGAAAAGSWGLQCWSQQDCSRERGWRRRAPAWPMPQKQMWYPKKRDLAGGVRTGELGWKMLLWGSCSGGNLQRLFPVPKLGVSGQDRVGNHPPPRGFLSHGTLPHALPMECSASLGGGQTRSQHRGWQGVGGREPSPPRGLGGDSMLCRCLLQHDKRCN